MKSRNRLGKRYWPHSIERLETRAYLSVAVYDLASQWSESANPNGVWAYRAGSTVLPPVANSDLDTFTPAQPGWASAPTGAASPFWFKYSSTVTFDAFPGLLPDWQTGDVVVHTANDPTQFANVTWTSPSNGVATVSGGVWNGRDIGRGNHWTLLDNGVALTSGDIFDGDPFNAANPFNFNAGAGGASAVTNLPVAAGDVITLQLDKTGSFGDYVGVKLSVGLDVAAGVSKTTASLQTSGSTVAPSQPVTLTSTVAPVPAPGGTPTGSVTFFDGGTALGSGTVQADGTASFTTSSLAIGFHTLTASYSGDSGFAASNSTVSDVLVAVPAAVGQLDPSFAVQGLASHNVGFSSTSAVKVQNDGKSVIAGTVGSPGSRLFGLTRYNADGSLDTSFGTNGVVTTQFGSTDDVASALTILPGGQILLAGTATSFSNGQPAGSEFAIARYNADGSPDTGFGGGAAQVLVSFSSVPGSLSSDVLNAMTVSAGGTIYLAGDTNAGASGGLDFALAALNSDGTPQAGFGAAGRVLLDLGGDDSIAALALQPDGALVAAGSTSNSASGVTSIGMVRLIANGSLDPKFGSKGKVMATLRGVDDQASSLALDAKGRILLGGSSATGSAADGSLGGDFVVIRYTKAGKLDRTFGHGPVITPFGQPAALTQILVQPDGAIVASGKTAASLSSLDLTTLDVAVARYTAAGALDPTFNGTGKVIISLAPSVQSFVVSPFDASSLMQAFREFTQSMQGALAMNVNGELFDVGNNDVNTVEAEIITSGVDLSAHVVSKSPGTVVGGAKGFTQVQIKEIGTARAVGSVAIQLQFALTAQGSGGSGLLSFSEHINLRAGASHVFKLPFNYAAGLADGQYFLLAIVSADPSVKNLNPAHGFTASPATIHIAPPSIHLSGTHLTPLSPFTPGKPAKVSLVLSNLGNTTAVGTTSVELLISLDQVQSNGTTLGSLPVRVNLRPRASRAYHLTVTLQPSVAAGHYFLLAVVDPDNSLGSFDSSNNLAISSGMVTVGAV